MKKIVILLTLLSLACVSSSCIRYSYPMEMPKTVMTEHRELVHVDHFSFAGHDYIIFDADAKKTGRFFVHDPDCRCVGNDKEPHRLDVVIDSNPALLDIPSSAGTVNLFGEPKNDSR